MFLVDTNVLIYAADESCEEHDACRALLERWRRQALPWYTTWSIVYEFLRVVTHPKVFRKPLSIANAWRFIEAVLASPTLTVLTASERHPLIAAEVLKSVPALRGNLLHDTHTAVLMREHGIERIYTRDADFNRFPFLKVIDPLTVREAAP